MTTKPISQIRSRVYRGSYRWESFLRMLSKHLTGDPTFSIVSEDEDGEVDCVYLGGGYWRAFLKHEDDSVVLVNPDMSFEEIAVITQAMNYLIRGF